MKKRSRHRDDDTDDLGELISRFHVTLGGLLIVCGVIGVIGAGLLIYGLTRDPFSILFTAIGGGVLFLGLVVLIMNVFNLGRRLELRKRGIRYVESGMETVMRWGDIADVHVERSDDTGLGVVSVRKRGGDAVTPSGPLTKTEWDVTIRAHDGREIHLRPLFFKMVADPRKLISQLRLRAGT